MCLSQKHSVLTLICVLENGLPLSSATPIRKKEYINKTYK